MRHNKKNTKKAIQRKLTTRKRWKNNRSLPRRTQYKTHKSYKQMRGGFVRTTIDKDLLKPSNNDPSKFEADSPMFVGASIIRRYNELKGQFYSLTLPDIPDKSTILTDAQIKGIKGFTNFYTLKLLDQKNRNGGVGNNSQVFSNLKELPSDEFEEWLKYILEGNVYKKKLPVYTDNEFNKFKSLALSLHILWQDSKQSSINPVSTLNREPVMNSRFFSTGFGDRW
jgi:hypothetical protein